MKKTVSTAGASRRLLWAKEHLGLEVADRAQTADDEPGAAPPAQVDGQAVERFDVDAICAIAGALAARASRITPTRSSADSSGCFFGLARTPITTPANAAVARRSRRGGRS